MASELFHKLLAKATVRDCATIQQLTAIMATVGIPPTTQAASLADTLYASACEFTENMAAIAAGQAGTKLSRLITYRCPMCGDPCCLGAVAVLTLSH